MRHKDWKAGFALVLAISAEAQTPRLETDNDLKRERTFHTAALLANVSTYSCLPALETSGGYTA